MEPHPHRNHYRIVIVTLFVGLALITIALIFYYQRIGMLQNPGAATTQSSIESSDIRIPIPITNQKAYAKKTSTGVSFTLIPKLTTRTYPVNSTITLQVMGDSNKNPVLGYDVVTSRNPGSYEVVSVTSLMPEFTVLKFVKNDYFTVTGILKPSVIRQVMFGTVPLAEIVIRPTKVGPLELTVLTEKGVQTSKVMSKGMGQIPEKLLMDSASTLRLDIN